VSDLGYRTYLDLEHKLILPVVRNALRLTANLMTARESYHEKRADYVFWSWDQVQNGLYRTREVTREIEDPVTGKKMKVAAKEILRTKQGDPIFQENPFRGTGITLANFEIKSFVYSEKVRVQIATQQEALMAVATARAEAEKARQVAKTVAEQGKAEVMRVKYEQLKIKEMAVIDAQKEKEVAELHAAKELEVAKLNRLAARETKEKEIMLGQGEAERKRLVLAADGALKQKLNTYEKVMAEWANAYARRPVPTVVMGGGGKGDTDTQTISFSEAVGLLVLDKLGLDLTVPKGAEFGKK
jgi:hypothetical protein